VLALAVAFGGMFGMDVAYAVYTKHIVGRRHYRAAAWAAAITFFNGVVVLAFVANPYMLLAACAGAAAGTVVGSKYL
jgi:uncharacterized membrane protein YdjX (TVP38/TMEM64 family)